MDTWNESAIKVRATRLANRGIEVWASPKLEAAILEAYGPKDQIAAKYSLDDHPYLLVQSVRPLFDAFRKEVLALDPCVSEEFLKLYVAYKAETNFWMLCRKPSGCDFP